MRVKICGIKSKSAIDAAARANADYIGFVFFEKSPRNLTILDATELATHVPVGICKTALVVNADDAFLDKLFEKVAIDMVQLHGSETPQRVAEIKARYGLPVMKAVGISDQSDLEKIAQYAQVADQLLIDAKPAVDSDLPGGNGINFDWQLIAGRRWAVPWMLAGGLTAQNVAQAISLTGARQVDVSSGVETKPGVKSNDMIAQFVAEAKGA